MTLSVLHSLGTGARTFAPVVDLATELPEIRTFDTAQELFDHWSRSGFRGRQLVHLSRYLHFVSPDLNAVVVGLDQFPIRTFDLPAFWSTRVEASNLLWVSVETGVARSLYHVLPPAELDARRAGLEPDLPGVRVEGRRIALSELGSPRVVDDRLPQLEEPVLLSIDASFLGMVPPEVVFRMLRDSGLRTDSLTLCRALDNPDVSPAERTKLDLLVALLESASR